MMNYHSDIIKDVLITEKTSNIASSKKYVFSVDYRAKKNSIKQAIQEVFPNIKVSKINLINVKPKKKRMGKFLGKTNKIKKAIITLTVDSEPINIFSE